MTRALSICPRCGYDLHVDKPLALGALSIDPRGDVRWRDEIVTLTPSQRIVLSSIARTPERYVGLDVLAERIGYEGDAPKKIVGKHLHLLRKLLPGAPIESGYGLGIRWSEANA